jgi:hypothetical protein
MCRNVSDPRGQYDCPGCDDRVRLEWRAPPGPIVACPTCGRHYRRTNDPTGAAEQVLDSLLLKDQSKRGRSGEGIVPSCADPWRVGNEVWVRFYDPRTDRYVAKLLGRVSGIGAKGFTVKLLNATAKGKRRQQFEYGAGVWPSKAEADAAIALQPRPPRR